MLLFFWIGQNFKFLDALDNCDRCNGERSAASAEIIGIDLLSVFLLGNLNFARYVTGLNFLNAYELVI
jgi:hypothetical protein